MYFARYRSCIFQRKETNVQNSKKNLRKAVETIFYRVFSTREIIKKSSAKNYKMSNTEIIDSCYGFQTSKPIYNEGKVITAVVSLYLSIPLSILATIGNGLILYAVFTTNALQKASNLALAFIAITDLAAGILSMPLGIAISILEMKSALTPCALRITYVVIHVLLTTLSFLMMGLLNMDMLLACSFPIKYKTWQLKKIYKWIFETVWFISIVIEVLFLSKILETDQARMILSVACLVTVTCMVSSKFRIYHIICSSNTRVHDMISQAAAEHRRKKQKKLLKTLVVITAFFLVCQFPRAIVLQFQLNEDSTSFYHALRYSTILVYVNSSLNPIIVCYRKEGIKRVILETLFMVVAKIRQQFIMQS